MSYSDYIIFADESGDPNLRPIDPNYPVFVLNFCVFRKDEYAASVLPAVAAFKFAHFGHDAVVLREQDIRRRNPPFAFLHVDRNRDAFMQGINAMISDIDFTIIADVIDKRRLPDQIAETDGLYEVTLRNCLEQTHAYLAARGQRDLVTHVVLEQRGNREDKALEQAFLRMHNNDYESRGPSSSFEIVFADKRSNSTGLQVADLTARPIGLHFIRPQQSNRAWDLLQPKVFRDAGECEHATSQD